MKILVINGPNLNMLGKRDKIQYGSVTLDDITKSMAEYIDWEFDFFQSNHEGFIIDKIHESLNVDGIIINAGGLTHTSVALRDALDIYQGPKVEVHLSDIYNREDFRRVNFIRDVCTKSIVGQKEKGYIFAIDYLKSYYNVI